ncbi:DUF4266 domain-containing protein [Rhizobacter sp. AJA081-3]|uniref:DUF4266 domain-containing protein n=1 Tax=Rhizobacter sp. AJA081-3 TaxID=2753607 RepID=UPI001ADEE037|nr:DUF4266 domain-containing protein [Rhizobacter sp. AJA081-3]QTN25700.1 DUF4266 domain-containing protein [Rhizobacter sp. AJA081-3]
MRHVANGAAIAILAAGLLSGCAGLEAPPAWDKGLLARPEMSMSWDPLGQAFRQHIHESREAASGGARVGGGGCGCN